MTDTSQPEPDLTHYQVLGVEPDAPHAAIRDAFLALAAAMQPDAMKDATVMSRYRRVKRAYDTLANESARRAYNQSLGLPAPPAKPKRDPFRKSEDVGITEGFGSSIHYKLARVLLAGIFAPFLPGGD